MSDYISKSALLKNLWDWRLQECPVGVCDEETETYKTICERIEAVEEQPTLDEKEIIRKPMELILARLKGIVVQRIAWYGMKDDICRGVDKAIKIIKEECGISE